MRSARVTARRKSSNSADSPSQDPGFYPPPRCVFLNAKAQREMQLKARRGASDEIAALHREISALEDEYQQVQAGIRKSSPQYSALTQPQPLDLKGIQRQLDPNTVLLEYSLGEQRSYAWVVTPDSLKTYELPKREAIENIVRRVNESLAARSLTAIESPAQRRARIAGADAEFEKAASESDLRNTRTNTRPIS